LWVTWGIGKTMQALAEMREMTNSWVLGERRFKRKGAEQLERRVGPSAKGGDRRSEEYRKCAKPIKVNPIGCHSCSNFSG
jgi:hypothetical protein